MYKTNCAFYVEKKMASGNHCKPTTKTDCTGCRFFKTNKQLAKEKERSKEAEKKYGSK